MSRKKNRKLIWTEEELQQGSPEWFRWRRGEGDEGVEMTLGGSEIAPLMYMSPYALPIDVYNWKLGIEEKSFSDEAVEAMEKGSRLEPKARKRYASENGVEVRTLCAVHPEHLWMRTSLDGITEDNRVILEIKSPRSFDNHVKQTRNGKVPSYRYPQLQWQIAVMRAHFPEVERVDYISYFDNECSPESEDCAPHIDMKVIPVHPDDEFIAELTRRGGVMIEHLRNRVPPPPTIFLDDGLEMEFPRPKLPKGRYWMPGLTPAL